MDQFGQNQFAPSAKSSLFVPDQLVVSTLQLVTDSGTITGGTFSKTVGAHFYNDGFRWEFFDNT